MKRLLELISKKNGSPLIVEELQVVKGVLEGHLEDILGSETNPQLLINYFQDLLDRIDGANLQVHHMENSTYKDFEESYLAPLLEYDKDNAKVNYPNFIKLYLEELIDILQTMSSVIDETQRRIARYGAHNAVSGSELNDIFVSKFDSYDLSSIDTKELVNELQILAMCNEFSSLKKEYLSQKSRSDEREAQLLTERAKTYDRQLSSQSQQDSRFNVESYLVDRGLITVDEIALFPKEALCLYQELLYENLDGTYDEKSRLTIELFKSVNRFGLLKSLSDIRSDRVWDMLPLVKCGFFRNKQSCEIVLDILNKSESRNVIDEILNNKTLLQLGNHRGILMLAIITCEEDKAKMVHVVENLHGHVNLSCLFHGLSTALKLVEDCKIQDLNLGFCRIDVLQHIPLETIVTSSRDSLERLSLRNISVTTGVANVLSPILPMFKNLRELNLMGCCTDLSETESFFQSLHLCTKLTKLNLRMNDIGENEVKKLCDVLQKSSIEEVDLRNNVLSEESLRELSKVVNNPNSKIKNLVVDSCYQDRICRTSPKLSQDPDNNLDLKSSINIADSHLQR